MITIEIKVNATSDQEAFVLKNALQSIATNFDKENLAYIAELSKKPKVNEKFKKLKSNPFVKSLL